MEKLTCRLLPFEIADGPTNMAADEVLLHSAQQGIASLRFYGWSEPTLSLGYFQSEKVRHSDPLLASLPFVRRPSGGETLVHHHELTYALGLPPGPWQAGEPWLLRMHRVIASALASIGVSSTLHESIRAGSIRDGPLCFEHFTPGDVIVSGYKVVGSAQRRQRGAIMQHGGILLATSPHAPALSGLRELIGTTIDTKRLIEQVLLGSINEMDAQVIEGPWTLDELAAIADLRNNKYSTAAWNCKR